MYTNYNRDLVLRGIMTIAMQLWIAHHLPGLPMTMLNMFAFGIGIVWILLGLEVEWLNPSVMYYRIVFRVQEIQVVLSIALLFWSAALTSLHRI